MVGGGLEIMSLFIHVILVSYMTCQNLTAIAASSLGGNETDRTALLSFKDRITDDPLHIMSSWNNSVHFCDWLGITCGRRHRRVTVLDLQDKKLVGSISPLLGNLSFLKTLSLLNNGFTGQIPEELGNLFRLQVLSLENNSFTGEIPSNISHCTNILYFGLGGNKLVGSIPMELESLFKLQQLVIPDNNLTGRLPHFLGNFSSLEIVLAGGNMFAGTIPDSLGRLPKLRILAVGVNMLSGTIPSSIYNLSSMAIFSVPENQLQGSLPSDLGFTLPNLQRLNLFSNKFNGHIPASLSNAKELSAIIIGKNYFDGKVPQLGRLLNLYWLGIGENNLGSGIEDDDGLSFLSYLTNCTNLRRLGLNDNDFIGMLPNSIGNLSDQLSFLTLGRNRIFGNIPDGLAELVNLENLGMESNELTGIIPEKIGKLHKLQVLGLSGNKLTGNIPSSLGNLSMIGELFLGQNQLIGNIPLSLSKCRRLSMLYIDQTNISGMIPQELFNSLPSLTFLDLSDNNLNASLPSEFTMMNLVSFDISNNMISGNIPSSLTSCTSLERLRMEGNFFQGTVPSLMPLRGLEDIDLSRNNLSGLIPSYLENFMFLRNLNLSFNNFEGEVPTTGVFKNASVISLAGNHMLCGGIPELRLPACINNSKKHSFPVVLKVAITVSCGLAAIALLLCFLAFWLKKSNKELPVGSSLNEDSLQRVSYGSIFKATDGFSSSNLIGSGGFGCVYKARFDQEETTVAVKVLNLQRQGAFKSFIAECEALRNIRHRNLVKVLTACSTVDFQGNDFKALVYEFMVNGSLEQWLHPSKRTTDETCIEIRSLTILERIDIAIDVASALDYLHHGCHKPIVHCDIKPSNVLLDSSMTAHVGDFGLVRFLGEDSETSSLAVKGSIGYAAPEYGLGSQVSEYGDLYSYGILLLEMFTGKRPTDNMPDDSRDLHNCVRMALVNGVMEIVDLQIFSGGEKEEAFVQYIQESIASILSIGLACSVDSPSARMGINEVVTKLKKIREAIPYMERLKKHQN